MAVHGNETDQLATLCAFIDLMQQYDALASGSLNDEDFDIVEKALKNPQKPTGSHLSIPSQ